MFTSTAGALYQAGILEVKKNFSHHFSVLANYTYSKAMDDALDYSYWGSNQLNTAGEHSLSSFDQRHKIVVASIIDSPLSGRILSGFQLSPVISYNSSHPLQSIYRNRHQWRPHQLCRSASGGWPQYWNRPELRQPGYAAELAF